MSVNSVSAVLDRDLVGSFEAETFSGGGQMWGGGLVYRVRMCPKDGAEEEHDGS